MGLLDLLLCPPPQPLHGPDPYLVREGLQLLLWLLVPGHMAKPRLEMLRTSLPLHPIPALLPGDGREGTPQEHGWEPVTLPGCPGGKGGLACIVPTSIQVPRGDTCSG